MGGLHVDLYAELMLILYADEDQSLELYLVRHPLMCIFLLDILISLHYTNYCLETFIAAITTFFLNYYFNLEKLKVIFISYI